MNLEPTCEDVPEDENFSPDTFEILRDEKPVCFGKNSEGLEIA